MRGVVLAGGTGSRLFPLTKVTNKHLLPVGKYPMIYHPVAKLRQAGVRQILIVTGREHMGDVVNLLGSGSDFNVSFTYRVQDEAGGIAQALSLAEDFASRQKVCVILGDNVFEDDLTPYVTKYSAQTRGAMVMLKSVGDPTRFGVAEVADGRIVGVEEKPKAPKSDLAVTGIYFYDARVYEVVRTLKPSGRGEMEITDVNAAYMREGELEYAMFQGWWSDAGTPSSFLAANELAKDVEYPGFGV